MIALYSLLVMYAISIPWAAYLVKKAEMGYGTWHDRIASSILPWFPILNTVACIGTVYEKIQKYRRERCEIKKILKLMFDTLSPEARAQFKQTMAKIKRERRGARRHAKRMKQKGGNQC